MWLCVVGGVCCWLVVCVDGCVWLRVVLLVVVCLVVCVVGGGVVGEGVVGCLGAMVWLLAAPAHINNKP